MRKALTSSGFARANGYETAPIKVSACPQKRSDSEQFCELQ